MTHKFDAKHKHKLDSEKRREILPPEKILISLGLDERDIMADIGCGTGYFTFPASKIIGDNSKIFAMDILPEMLQEIEAKINENNISNITTVLTEENDLKLEDGEVTFAFISNVLHEADDKEKFLTEIKRIISLNGRIAIVEWQKVDSEFGPPIDHRVDKKYLEQLLNGIGFNNIISSDINQYFYYVTGEK